MGAFHRANLKPHATRAARARPVPDGAMLDTRMLDPVDRFVGRRLELARELAGLSLWDVARRTAMQAHRLEAYESGADRIAPLVLHNLASLYDQPISYFFGATEAACSDRA